MGGLSALARPLAPTAADSRRRRHGSRPEGLPPIHPLLRSPKWASETLKYGVPEKRAYGQVGNDYQQQRDVKNVKNGKKAGRNAARLRHEEEEKRRRRQERNGDDQEFE
jgi:hypothetical protein